MLIYENIKSNQPYG